MTPKRPTKRHIIGKMSKIKERVLKALRGNQLVNIMEAIFSAETLQTRMEQHDVFKVLKQNKTNKQKFTTKNTLSSKVIIQN